MEGLLFIYEGGAADGRNLPGHISGKKLTIEGDWVEHLIESPSKKEIVQTHLVKIDGNLDSKWFRGTVTIGDIFESRAVRLKRVNHICPRICLNQLKTQPPISIGEHNAAI
jgi:hypothetical protein